MKSTAQVFIKF